MISAFHSFVRAWRGNGRLRTLTAAIFIGLCLWQGLQGAFVYDDAIKARSGSSVRMDNDTQNLTEEVATVNRTGGIQKWWHGPWYPDTPYFRPLTITLFWTEWKVFGENGRVAMTWIHRLNLLIFVVLLFAFFNFMAGPARATLATGMFAGGFNAYFNLPTGLDAFNCWKDQCDMWTGWVFLATCWTYVIFLRRGEKWRLALCLGLWLVGLTIKETAYCFPFMLTVLLFLERKVKTHWWSLLPFYLLAPLAWLYRWFALQGHPPHTGSNGSWTTRWMEDAMGIPGDVALGDGASMVCLAAIVLVWMLVKWREGPRDRRLGAISALWLMVLALGLWKSQRYMADSGGLSLLRFFNITPWNSAFSLAVILVIYAIFFRRLGGDRRFLLAYGWIWVIFLPLAYQPPTSTHVHFLLAPGWSLLLVCCLLALPDWASEMWKVWGVGLGSSGQSLSLGPKGGVEVAN